MMWRAALVGLAALAAAPAGAEITSARFADPTMRYDHGILGDAVEYGTLELHLGGGQRRRIVLPDTRVFEDLAPRLADLDGDGAPEVIVVETDLSRGARLSVYGAQGLISATPFIGRTHRWLAPIGAADLDGDGRVEIAYIDRPHLAQLLRVWRFEGGVLTLVAEADGLTNHRIGDTSITSGIRNCGGPPKIITADATWSRVMATTLSQGRLDTRPLGLYRGPGDVTAALACP